MLNLARSTIIAATIQKYGERCISSVIPELKLPEFCLYNEPILSYNKGTKERCQLESQLERTANSCEEIPIIIGNREYCTSEVRYQVMPHNHGRKLAKFYHADNNLIQKAIETATETQKEWDRTPIEERLMIWQRAADMMACQYRQELNAATMLGQSKTVIQAEIDSAAELIDFIRMNAYYLKEAVKYQPISENTNVVKNSLRLRGIDGFIAAITPFNFTAIGGNLAFTPALMGNSVLWKPSDTAMLSNWVIFKIMREAGVPPGVVNFIPCEGPVFGETVTKSPHLAAINFTGSVNTFNWLFNNVGANIGEYKNFPRLIGECGGKNFHFVHPTADVATVSAATIRSSFEYCGQKCSACSRLYAPESLWPQIKECLLEIRQTLKFGNVVDFECFSGAVIDAKAFERITSYIEYAMNSPDLTIIGGGGCCSTDGYFIEPTIIVTTNPKDKIMHEEIFGPVLTVYVYKDSEVNKTMDLVDCSTKYALSGAVFGRDEKFLSEALDVFKMSAGNFNINDKSTGSVVGQQPFGGGRMSGTNDKAGGPHYIMRFTSPQSIKETFVPQTEVFYPYMQN